jgi:hypothetical protein
VSDEKILAAAVSVPRESRNKVQAVARVQITVEFMVDGAWGGDFPIEKIHEQARESAVNVLMRGLAIDGLTVKNGSKTQAHVVGQPKVTAILVESQS